MKTKLSDIVKLVNPQTGGTSGKGSNQEGGDNIKTATLEEPEEGEEGEGQDTKGQKSEEGQDQGEGQDTKGQEGGEGGEGKGQGEGGEGKGQGEEGKGQGKGQGEGGEGQGQGEGGEGQGKGQGNGPQGEGGEGGAGEGEGPMVNSDSIDNVRKSTTVIRNDITKGKSGGKVVGRGTGEVITPAQGKQLAKEEGYEDRPPLTEEQWKEIARTAAKAHLNPQTKLSARNDKKGGGSGAIYQKIMDLTDPIVDWRAELRRFIGKLASSSDFKFPSRRSIGTGDYRYGIKTQNNALENGVVAIDVSGSVAAAFPDFASEVVGIAAAKKIKQIAVLPFAERVVDPIVLKNFKKPQPSDFEHVRTGGGTEAIPDVMSWIKDNIRDRPDFVVIITDGHLTHGLPVAPKWGKKTIWLVFDNSTFDVPPGWGQVIHAIGDKRYFDRRVYGGGSGGASM
jgi:hypothetical protein